MILTLLFLSQISNVISSCEKWQCDANKCHGKDCFAKIAYEEIELTEEDLVWAEKNHNYGDNSGAFYSPRHITESFYLLGDKHCRYGSDDCKKLIAVKEFSFFSDEEINPGNVLIKPTHGLLQWKDEVDGKVSVSVFVLDAKKGYQCVGDVAIPGDHSVIPPDIMDRYRCVKNTMLEHIQLGRLVISFKIKTIYSLYGITYFREIWNTDNFESYEMSFSGYAEPPTETTVESGCFVGYRTKIRGWADDEQRLVAIKKSVSVRSDGWDPSFPSDWYWQPFDHLDWYWIDKIFHW